MTRREQNGEGQSRVFTQKGSFRGSEGGLNSRPEGCLYNGLKRVFKLRRLYHEKVVFVKCQ